MDNAAERDKKYEEKRSSHYISTVAHESNDKAIADESKKTHNRNNKSPQCTICPL